jgi:DNA-binding beta-propeller fold protein YncE
MRETLPNFLKYIPELSPDRLGKNLRRLWKRKINPPPERSVFSSPEEKKIMAHKIAEIQTRMQPKQVCYSPELNQLLVSCMAGRALQFYSPENGKLRLTSELSFPDQCVEVTTQNNLAFLTTTNFERPPRETHNHIHIIDIPSQETISTTETQGNWSKFIAVNNTQKEVLISNWHSHDISIIDIVNPQSPKVKQIISWGEAPRGIAITKDGQTAVITGFYSGNIGILQRNKQDHWETTFTSRPYDAPNYPGNPRHILLDEEEKTAFVSNLGRNSIHFWSLTEKKFMDTVSVGKEPNTITFADEEKQKIAVSCRGSNRLYFIDTVQRAVTGVSEQTRNKPTGLCRLPNNQLALTSFGENSLSIFQLT